MSEYGLDALAPISIDATQKKVDYIEPAYEIAILYLETW